MKRARSDISDDDLGRLLELVRMLKDARISPEHKTAHLLQYRRFELHQVDSPGAILAELRGMHDDDGLFLYIQSEFTHNHNVRVALLEQSNHPYAHWALAQIPGINRKDYHLAAAADGGMLSACFARMLNDIHDQYAKGCVVEIYPFVKAMHPKSQLWKDPKMQRLRTAFLGSVLRARRATLCWMWIHKTTICHYFPRDVALIIANYIWEARKTGPFFSAKCVTLGSNN